MIEKLRQIEGLVCGYTGNRMIVVAAHDENVLSAVKEVYDKKYLDLVLIGDKEKILKIADQLLLDISRINIIKELDVAESARIAVNMVKNGEAEILMKGLIQTADFMRAVMEKDKGLRTNRLISHVEIVEPANYPKLLLISDAGINIAPDLKQKADIIRNAVEVAHKLGIAQPKVAVLSAIESVNPDIESTIDASALSKMAQRGQITGCIVDGPLSMDLAISNESVRQKGVISEVAGNADILIPPDINTANILLKALVFLGKNDSCSVLTGTRVPLVVTSRADSSITKYYSILLALAMSIHREEQ
ncbi:MAG: bifunctional enoyl-CoA hydratase/phosphate acetyltransferase [Thermoclostridium sp.]|nr:bifunctional enoyl-CoA hydratase/phosphate acetyltransferase [Thermoclostridium sp.]